MRPQEEEGGGRGGTPRSLVLGSFLGPGGYPSPVTGSVHEGSTQCLAVTQESCLVISKIILYCGFK